MGEHPYHCPVGVRMDVIGRKWTAVILAHLKESPGRFCGLCLVPGATEKMLTQRLRELEREGIVVRTVHSATPPHVEYDLSDEGRSLVPALQALYDWGEWRARERSLVVEPTQPGPA